MRYNRCILTIDRFGSLLRILIFPCSQYVPLCSALTGSEILIYKTPREGNINTFPILKMEKMRQGWCELSGASDHLSVLYLDCKTKTFHQTALKTCSLNIPTIPLWACVLFMRFTIWCQIGQTASFYVLNCCQLAKENCWVEVRNFYRKRVFLFAAFLYTLESFGKYCLNALET